MTVSRTKQTKRINAKNDDILLVTVIYGGDEDSAVSPGKKKRAFVTTAQYRTPDTAEQRGASGSYHSAQLLSRKLGTRAPDIRLFARRINTSQEPSR